jgi:hypothetical protein
MFHVVASSMLAVVAMSSSVSLLGKDLLGQLALLGQLVISDERLISEVYPVLGRGEVTGDTDSLNYGNSLLLLGANLGEQNCRGDQAAREAETHYTLHRHNRVV